MGLCKMSNQIFHFHISEGMGYHRTMNSYTAIVKKQGDWWIGWIAEVPGVNCQERIRDELLVSLRETLCEIIEINSQDAFSSIPAGYERETVFA